MLKKFLSLSCACLCMLLMGTSCTQRLTDFTVISTKNYPVEGKVEVAKADKRVKGVDKKHIVLCIPIGAPNMKEAIDKAIEQYPGAVGLADGVVKSNFWHAFLYGQNSYIVEGTPLYLPNGTVQQTTATATSSGSSESDALLFYHEVKAGDTLQSIAQAYGVTVTDIIKWNKLSSPNVTKGTKLKVVVQ